MCSLVLSKELWNLCMNVGKWEQDFFVVVDKFEIPYSEGRLPQNEVLNFQISLLILHIRQVSTTVLTILTPFGPFKCPLDLTFGITAPLPVDQGTI